MTLLGDFRSLFRLRAAARATPAPRPPVAINGSHVAIAPAQSENTETSPVIEVKIPVRPPSISPSNTPPPSTPANPEPISLSQHRVQHALEHLPEFTRQSVRLMDVLSTTLAQTRPRDEALLSVLHRLDDSVSNHNDSIESLQRQLEITAQSSLGASNSVQEIQPALTELVNCSRQTNALLVELRKAAAARETRFVDSLIRTERWVIAAVAVCGIACAAAIVIAVMAWMQGR